MGRIMARQLGRYASTCALDYVSTCGIYKASFYDGATYHIDNYCGYNHDNNDDRDHDDIDNDDISPRTYNIAGIAARLRRLLHRHFARTCP